MMHLAIVLLVGVLFIAQPSWTQIQEQGQASLWLDRDLNDGLSVKLVETLTVAMRVEGQAPLEAFIVEKPRSTESWHIELAGKPKVTILEDGKHTRWELTFLAKPLQPGKQPLTLPALQFSENGGPSHDIKWEPLLFNVTTRVSKADVGEVRDRTGIEELPNVPPAPRPWWPWLLTAVPLLATVALVAWRWRSRPAAEPSAQTSALDQLKALGKKSLANRDEIGGFYTQLSMVLRTYLESTCGLPATQRTTAEVVGEKVAALPFDDASKTLLIDVLRRCDVAKFAGTACTAHRCDETLAMAVNFVQRTGVNSKTSR
jgi:hypothetical protein